MGRIHAYHNEERFLRVAYIPVSYTHLPRMDDLMLSSPDIMPTLLGLAGLADSIATEVQGRNYAPILFDENEDIVRPPGALYIQNLDGEKDAEGMVRSYFRCV